MTSWRRACTQLRIRQLRRPHAERRRPGVTMELLHLEYLQREPGGYRYSWFCHEYMLWAKRRGATMCQVHRAGEKEDDRAP